ncbi:MAG: hypothetical protein KUL86_01590 [Castellaniella sp.]|nr:hypothetical protein [Castellaniella sp.]
MDNATTNHEAFILDVVLPVIMGQARAVNCDPLEAALAVFMSLGTLLLTRGYTPDSLLQAIRASAVTTHDAPGGLQ